MNRLLQRAVSMTLAFAMVLGITFTGMPAFAEEQEQAPLTLVAGNSTWKYLDHGTDQGTVWQSVYDDSTWATGSAPFGYKDSGTGVSSKQFGALSTTISYGSNKSKKYRTSYFRTNINVNIEEVTKFGEILGSFAYDDGVVLYLNGAEIFRGDMPVGVINFQTKSSSNLSDPNEHSKVDLTEMVKINLKDGNNELSAEVHQSTDSSSDLYWDMSLIAYPAVEPVQPGVGKPDSIALTFNGNPQTSMGFNWYTPETVTGTILEIVEASKLDNGQFPTTGTQSYEGTFATNSVFMTKATKSANKPVLLTSHKVIADGLQPGTKYAYRAGDGQAYNWSDIGFFSTEATDKQGYNFLYTTDSQGTIEVDFDIWNHTLQEGLAKFPASEFILNSGDLVDNGDIEEQWGWFFNKPKDILANIPLVPLVGNHESKNYSNYSSHFNLPNISNTGAKPDGSVYSFDYGQAHYMVINTEYYGTSTNLANNEIYNKQVEWLRSEAARSNQKWKVVLLHKSPYSVASHTNDTDVLFYRANLTKVFDELGIDMVLGGHDHTYARSYQMYNNQPLMDIVPDANGVVNDPKGTLYLITNAAGNKKYNVASGPFPFAAKYGQPDKEMFTGMTVTNDELSYESYTTITNGSTDLYDKYSIHKSDVTVNPVRNAKATVTDSGKVTLSWDAPETGAVITGYRIYEQNDQLSANWSVNVPATEGKASYSYSVENTDPSKTYQFVIKAVSDRTNSEGVIVSYKVDEATPTPTPTPTATPEVTPTATPEVTPTATPEVTPTTTPEVTPTATPEVTPTATPEVTPTATPTTAPTVTPTATPVIKPSLTDSGNHWASAAIEKALAAGFVNGYADQTFRPNEVVNRVEFITMLARALKFPEEAGETSFKDSTKIPGWAKSYVAQAISMHIISGYDDGTFRPKDELTRTELAVMVVRALGIKVDSKAILSFKDATDVPAWAIPYVAAASEAGIMSGIGQNRFAPNQKATRAESVTLILALLEKMNK